MIVSRTTFEGIGSSVSFKCVVAVVTDMGDVASKWNEAKAAETWRRTLTIADESHRSIELTVFDWDEQTDASLGGIISVKARTDDFMGVPQLKCSLKDVNFAASIPEAHALQNARTCLIWDQSY